MDKETGKEVLIDGKPVTAETTFKPEESSVDALRFGFNICMDRHLFFLIGNGFKRNNGFPFNALAMRQPSGRKLPWDFWMSPLPSMPPGWADMMLLYLKNTLLLL